MNNNGNSQGYMRSSDVDTCSGPVGQDESDVWDRCLGMFGTDSQMLLHALYLWDRMND